MVYSLMCFIKRNMISLWIILRAGYATELSPILVAILKYIFKN